MPTRYHRLRRLTVGNVHPTSVTSGPYRIFSDDMLSVTDGFSAASGRERPVKSNEKLMNAEHRTSNIERRIMYAARRELLCRTVYFITD
jgi:hypothetical protein